MMKIFELFTFLLFVFEVFGNNEGWLQWKRYTKYGELTEPIFNPENTTKKIDGELIQPFQIVEVGSEDNPNCLSKDFGELFEIIPTSLGIRKIQGEIEFKVYSTTTNCTGESNITRVSTLMLSPFFTKICTPAKEFFSSQINSTECYNLAYSESLDSFVPKKDGELITEETKQSKRYLEFETYEGINNTEIQNIESIYSQYVLVGGCAMTFNQYLKFFEGQSTLMIAYFSDSNCERFVSYFVYDNFILNETIGDFYQMGGDISFKIHNHSSLPPFPSEKGNYIEIGLYMTDKCVEESYNDEMFVSKIVLPKNKCIDDLFGQFDISGNKFLRYSYEIEEFTKAEKKNQTFDCDSIPVKIDVTTYNISKCEAYNDLPQVKDFLFNFGANTNKKQLVDTVYNYTYLQSKVTDNVEHLRNYYVLFPNCDSLDLVEVEGVYHRPARYGFFMNQDVCFVEPSLTGNSFTKKGFKGYCEKESLMFRQYSNDMCLNDYKYVFHQKDSGMCLRDPFLHENELYLSCDFRICNGYEYWEERVCSGHGKCVQIEVCECDDGYEDDDCETIKNGWVVGFVITAIILVVFIFVLVVCLIPAIVFGIIFFIKNQEFKNIEDIDILLEESKVKKQSNVTATLKIKKELFQIDYKDIKVIEKIGKGGSNAVCYLVDYLGSPAAFKCFITTDICDDNEENFTEFEKEVEIMANVKHPYILNFLGASLFVPRVGILMEFCENGDLKSYLQKNKDLEISKRIEFLFQIASATRYLHSKNIIHRDLKLENVLVTKGLEMRLMDFGLSCSVKNNSKTKTKRVGTSYYIAPEVLSGKYDEKCDVFSFSFMIFEIIQHNFKPFGKKNLYQLEYKIAKDPNLRPEIDDKKYAQCIWMKELTKTCWNHEPKERLSFDEIVDTFLKNMKLENKKENSFNQI